MYKRHVDRGYIKMRSVEKEMAPGKGANQTKMNYQNINKNEISGKEFIANLTKKFQTFLGQHQSSLLGFSKEGA